MEHSKLEDHYLEALDCDIRKPHENPSVGIILCKSKDEDVADESQNSQQC